MYSPGSIGSNVCVSASPVFFACTLVNFGTISSSAPAASLGGLLRPSRCQSVRCLRWLLSTGLALLPRECALARVFGLADLAVDVGHEPIEGRVHHLAWEHAVPVLAL